MDRVIAYTGAIPQDTDLLLTNRNAMVGLGYAVQAVLGTSTAVDGLACTPTSPATMTVNVANGSIYSLQNLDATAYGSLAADNADQIVKQGISLGVTNFPCPAPAGSGQSVVYLVEAIYQDVDGGAAVLPYYNASNPAVAYSGPAGSGISQNTVRKGVCTLTLKTGVAATTGSQVTPAPDAGYVGLWAVTVANGQTTVTSGNIAKYPGAPFVNTKLTNLGTIATQNANAVAVTGGAVDGTTLGGTTPAAVSATTLNTTGNVTLTGGGSTVTVKPTSGDGSLTIWGGNGSASWGQLTAYSGSGVAYVGTANAQPFAFKTNNAEAGRFDASGNFMVGTTGQLNGSLASFNGAVTVGGAGGSLSVRPAAGDGSLYVWGGAQLSSYGQVTLYSSSGLGWAGTTNNQPFAFKTNNVEAGRFDTSGNFMVGTSTPSGRLTNQYSGASQYGAQFSDTNSAAGTDTVLNIVRNGTQVGTITCTLSGSSYNTSSDKRLKENVAPLAAADAAGNVIDRLAPVTYTWAYIEGNPAGTGFLAQDLYEVIPEAVTAGDDGPASADGKVARQWSVDYSKIVPRLVAEVQGLRKRVAALEAEES